MWLAVLFSGSSAADLPPLPGSIEVFITTELDAAPQSLVTPVQRYPGPTLQVYPLDGIRQAELTLSGNLPNDTEAAQQIALQRIHQLNKQGTAQMQQAAVGLAKAMRYGIDRYPAIVFDGQAVVYGETDLQAALTHYQAWRAGDKP